MIHSSNTPLGAVRKEGPGRAPSTALGPLNSGQERDHHLLTATAGLGQGELSSLPIGLWLILPPGDGRKHLGMER